MTASHRTGRYRAYGRSLDSDRPLPELPRCEGTGPPDVRLSWDAAALPRDLRWIAIWPESAGRGAVWFARRRGRCFFRFDGVADAIVAPGGDLRIAANPEADPSFVRHIVLDQVLPLAFAAAGDLVIHASAVRVDGGAVLFAGDAGSGKSTLAAAMAKRGCAVVADDGLVVEARGGVVCAVPSYGGLRLWPDAAEAVGVDGYAAAAPIVGTSKRRLHVGGVGAGSELLPVHALYSLERGSSVRFEPLSRRDLTIELIRHAFTPDATDPAALRCQLDRASRCAAGLQGWRLTSAAGLAQIGELAGAVAAHAGAAASGRLLGR